MDAETRDTIGSIVPDTSEEGLRAASSGREEAYERLFRDGHRFDFFQAVRLLERRFSEAPAPGESTAYRETRIRFQPAAAPVFPTADVKHIEQLDEPYPHARLTATFMGLYGIDSPLPYYFYNDLATGADDTLALRDFLDVFNHRLYAFFYRAWKKYRPALHDRAEGGSREQPDATKNRSTGKFLALAGLGTPGVLETLREGPLSPMRLAAFAGRMMGRQHNAEGLRVLLGEFLKVPVEIVENVPRRVSIRRRPTAGTHGGMTLGQGAVVGASVLDRAGRFRIRIGPVGLATYRAFLPGGDLAGKLQWLTRSYTPDHLDFEVELRLRADEVPETRLSGDEARLGLTTFLGRSTRAEISRVIHYDAQQISSST